MSKPTLQTLIEQATVNSLVGVRFVCELHGYTDVTGIGLRVEKDIFYYTPIINGVVHENGEMSMRVDSWVFKACRAE